MDPRPPLVALVEPPTILRFLSLSLVAALLMLADGYVLILLSRILGIYLLLALTASTGLLGLLAVAGSYRSEVRELYAAVSDGRYPARQFRRMIPILAGAVLLVVPGFVTDGVGVLLLIRPVGWLFGALVERRLRHRLQQLYEYVRLHV